MKLKTIIGTVVALAVACSALFSGANETYTVKTPVWETTNAVQVIRNHEPGCTLVKYVERGRTNEFHAWAVPVVVTTNAPVQLIFGDPFGGIPFTNANVILIGQCAYPTRDRQLVITWEDGTEWRVDLPTNTWVRGWTNFSR